MSRLSSKALVYLNSLCHFETVFSFIYYLYRAGLSVYLAEHNICRERKKFLENFPVPFYYTKNLDQGYQVVIVLTYDKDTKAQTKNRVEVVHNRRKVGGKGFFCSLTPLLLSDITVLPIYFPPKVADYKDLLCNYDRPVFVVQGNIVPYRRNYNCLFSLPRGKYTVVIAGRTYLQYANLTNKLKNTPNIVVVDGPSESDFFNIIRSADFVLPLVDNSFRHDYLSSKLSSSVSISLGLRVLPVINRQLAEVYGIPGILYNGPEDFPAAFSQAIQIYGTARYKKLIYDLELVYQKKTKENIETLRRFIVHLLDKSPVYSCTV